MDNPFTFPTCIAIQQPLHCKPMEESNSKEWPPGILSQLQSETCMLSSSCQTQRRGESNMANFQIFNT
ncbi:unnamed protein product, partial [Bubo scandiacus]